MGRWVIIRTWLNRAACIAALSVHWRVDDSMSTVRSYIAGPDGLIPLNTNTNGEARESCRAATRAWFDNNAIRDVDITVEVALKGWHQ